MFDLVIFDLDGTLVATAGEISDTVNDVLGVLGLPPVAEEQVRGWIGQGSRELMIRACAHASGRPQAEVRDGGGMDSVMELYARCHGKRCGTRSYVFPQVADTLAALRERNVALALVTNREARLAEAVLRSHGLRHFFDPVVAGDTLAARKPDAAPVLHCLRARGVRPERALLVGDSAIDVATARNAGIACWAVPYGYNGGGNIADAGADRVIPDISAVLAARCCGTEPSGSPDQPCTTPAETSRWP